MGVHPSGRGVARLLAALGMGAVIATPAVYVTAAMAADPPSILVAASTIVATPTSAPPGATIAVDGAEPRWQVCQLDFDEQPVLSTCDVSNGHLTGTLQIPPQAKDGSHLIRACYVLCPSSPPSSSPSSSSASASSSLPSPILAQAVGTCCTTVSTTVMVVRPPTLVAVPSLRAMTLDTALASLHAAKLLGGYSIALPHGHVVTQVPTPGSMVPLHSRVRFTLESWIVVPALANLTLDQARSELGTDLTLRTNDTSGLVDRQQPEPGTEVPPGTVVTVTLVSAPPPSPTGGVNDVRIAIVTAAVLTGVAVATRVIRGRRRRRAHRWYHDHVQWTTTARAELKLTEPAEGAFQLPSVRLTLRDTKVSSCQLEEAPTP